MKYLLVQVEDDTVEEFVRAVMFSPDVPTVVDIKEVELRDTPSWPTPEGTT